MTDPTDGLVLNEAQKRRRRRRNVAIALILTLMVVMFYVITLIKLGGSVAQRAL